jgi:hypothetical protein
MLKKGATMTDLKKHWVQSKSIIYFFLMLFVCEAY